MAAEKLDELGISISLTPFNQFRCVGYCCISAHNGLSRFSFDTTSRFYGAPRTSIFRPRSQGRYQHLVLSFALQDLRLGFEDFTFLRLVHVLFKNSHHGTILTSHTVVTSIMLKCTLTVAPGVIELLHLKMH